MLLLFNSYLSILFSFFFIAAEQKVLDLVDRFEELKESGKLKKHIEKRNKKRLQQDRKKYALDSIDQ